MAAPVIDSVTPANVVLHPGEFADVVVVAHDPDSASGSVQFPVTDSAGNQTLATVDLRLDDPLTFGEAIVDPGLNATVQQIAAEPGQAVYRVTAAAA